MREWNNCFIKFLKLPKFDVRNTSEKSEKIQAKSKNELDEDAMLCNTLWSDRRTLVRKKHFLPFRVLLNVGIVGKLADYQLVVGIIIIMLLLLSLKKFFLSFLALFRGKLRFPAKTFAA